MEFNRTRTDGAATTNHEGGEAYLPESPQLGLYKLVVNNLLEDTYYEEDVEQLRELATRFERVHFHRETPTLSAVEKLRAARVDGATNGWKVFDALAEAGDAYDRVVLLTDMQLWDSTRGGERTLKGSFDRYRQEVAPDARLYEVDLSSYGHLATPEGHDGVYRVSGWNDRIVDFVVHAEAGDEAVETVRSWTPPQFHGG